MTNIVRQDWRREVRTFSAGAACGFLGGALFVFVVLWQYHLVRLPWQGASPTGVTVIAEPHDGVAAVVEPGQSRPAATTGREDADTPFSPAAVIGPLASSAPELEKRDLLIPVEGVGRDQLTRQFSDERGSHKHEALDIPAPRHTPVRAVEDGTIARLFFSKAGGITVYQFDPSTAFCYYYAHLDRYAEGLREGQSVRKGQIVGYVGTSGNAPKNTPHLHFAIFRLTEAKRWWEGTPIDPYDILR